MTRGVCAKPRPSLRHRCQSVGRREVPTSASDQLTGKDGGEGGSGRPQVREFIMDEVDPRSCPHCLPAGEEGLKQESAITLRRVL